MIKRHLLSLTSTEVFHHPPRKRGHFWRWTGVVVHSSVDKLACVRVLQLERLFMKNISNINNQWLQAKLTVGSEKSCCTQYIRTCCERTILSAESMPSLALLFAVQTHTFLGIESTPTGPWQSGDSDDRVEPSMYPSLNIGLSGCTWTMSMLHYTCNQ